MRDREAFINDVEHAQQVADYVCDVLEKIHPDKDCEQDPVCCALQDAASWLLFLNADILELLEETN